jgi:hypothetical protein
MRTILNETERRYTTPTISTTGQAGAETKTTAIGLSREVIGVTRIRQGE